MADACLKELAVRKGRTGNFRARVSTVVGFFVEFIDTFSMIDSVVIVLCWVADHADLIMLIDEVACK